MRTDKPAMLYWLQMAAYLHFGINEFAARLPSAVASILAVLLTYELGRRLYGRSTGVIAGSILASAPAFCAAAHFANPDALLNLFTLLTFAIFWRGYIRNGSGWFALAGISTGLAMLTKGPVGLVLPAAVIGLFLYWSGQLNRLCDRRLLWGCLTFLVVSGPWYGWVGNDTRWEFLKGFFLKHNLDRFRAPMEGHSGPFFYYLAVLLAGFLFWACFFGPALWCACLELRQQRPGQPENETESRS
ncbi:MAG: ArnT family glycosyltransferase, partial [Gemmataceae bacterium]